MRRRTISLKSNLVLKANFDARWLFIQQEELELRFHVLSFTAWLRVIKALINIINDL